MFIIYAVRTILRGYLGKFYEGNVRGMDATSKYPQGISPHMDVLTAFSEINICY